MRTKHLCVMVHIRNKGEVKNMSKPSSNFLTDYSKAMPLLWILFVFHVCLCHAIFSVPCSLVVVCLERAHPLALLWVMFSCVLSLSHMVSWVRCGTKNVTS